MVVIDLSNKSAFVTSSSSDPIVPRRFPAACQVGTFNIDACIADNDEYSGV
jgi:hypothetical protein